VSRRRKLRIRNTKRIRKMSKVKSRAILAPYIAELERAKVPPSVIDQAATLMSILLVGR
jgi:hypothetical protein